MTTIVAMADTHGFHTDLRVPDGDLLIHAGDLTQTGTLEELAQANAFLRGLPHRHKIVVAGNHDWAFEKQPDEARRILDAALYLEDDEVVVDGMRIFGSPWQPWFLNWAFNLPRGPSLAEKWARIPEGLDILVTHGPPLGFGDRVKRGEHVGCADLLERVRRVRPRLHLFGHIHEDRGRWDREGTRFVNVTTNECEEAVTVLSV